MINFREVNEYDILKEHFTSLDYDTYTFILSGHNGNKLKDATREDWIKDCINNIELLKSKGYLKVIIVGHSMGGVLATIMAIKYPKYINKLILIDPSFEYLKMKNGKLKIIPSIKQSFILFKELSVLKKNHYSHILSCSLSSLREFHDLVKEHRKDIEKVTCPLLLLHGEKDSIVPLDRIKKIYDKLNNKDKELVIVKNGSHWFFSSKQNDEVYISITIFIGML